MTRRPSVAGLVSARAVFVAAAVVLAAVLGGVAAAAGGGAVSGDASGTEAANGTDGLVVDPPTYDPARPTATGTATVVSDGGGNATDGENATAGTYESLTAAVDAAEPGDAVELSGVFEPTEPVVVDEPNVTVRASETHGALVDGRGEDSVVVLEAPNAAIEGVWIHDTGEDLESQDAGVYVAGNASGATLSELYLTDAAFGVWVNGADEVTVADSRIEGTEAPRFANRGNGINLWETEGSEIRDTEITDVRDGIYYSWASDVEATGNTLWDLRYGVHYMYSDDNRIADNVAFENDVGYALMVSDSIEVVNNTAVANRGQSGHGILLKEIDRSVVRDNRLVANDDGIFLYNAQHNEVRGNLLYANGVGVHHSAGTSETTVAGNGFVENEEPVLTTTRDLVAWNGSDRGNYWSDARVADADGDGISDTRHRPAGAAQRLVQEHPAAAVFADGPAFDAIRLVESRFPAVETAGVVDHRPLADPVHDVEPYRPYAAAVDATVEYDSDPGDDHHQRHQ
ncbi:nitrous oxide reductase family maturation protein NosD [Halorubrum sp. Eb13]|uniref:nitrous oxide reductase family maturation protein NosD n=1 Tax=Halorubrum sp. Eb13 TaxID=1383843 RepID=UPI000B980E30|nr:nitrous oxide reductase family maturation protein NosD [Halorubrum sp. Eb13]OYR45209.1 copper-binding protein [Halorubrum sp. Eb13]